MWHDKRSVLVWMRFVLPVWRWRVAGGAVVMAAVVVLVETEEGKIGDVAVEIHNVVAEEAEIAVLEWMADYQKWNQSPAQQSSTVHSSHRIVRMVQCDVVVVERLHRPPPPLHSPHHRCYHQCHHHGCCNSLVVVPRVEQ